MRAFLSHSSKDKHFVREVANELGVSLVEYDEVTFEFTLNNRAIRSALHRCTLFVLFLSENSISSNFVAEEERAALEARGRGSIKDCIVFALDNTSYQRLPEWLRETNIVQRLSKPKPCARRILAALAAIDAQKASAADLYLGREDDEKNLRRALTVPRTAIPVALHVVGLHGIGRKTFTRRSLSNTYPRLFSVFVDITCGQFDGINEFYRGLYQLTSASSYQILLRI